MLGAMGANFAAGMSGGVAFVLDLEPALCNVSQVHLEQITDEDAADKHRDSWETWETWERKRERVFDTDVFGVGVVFPEGCDRSSRNAANAIPRCNQKDRPNTCQPEGCAVASQSTESAHRKGESKFPRCEWGYLCNKKDLWAQAIPSGVQETLRTRRSSKP